MALNVDTLPADLDQFQLYLNGLKSGQLVQLDSMLSLRFEQLMAGTDEERDIERLTNLTSQVEACRKEAQTRKTQDAKAAATLAAQEAERTLANLQSIVSGNGDKNAQPPESAPSPTMEGLVEALGQAMNLAVTQVTETRRTGTPGLNNHIRAGRDSLGRIAQNGPDPRVPAANTEAVLVASSDIPGRAGNSRVQGILDLTDLISNRARMMPVTKGNPNYVPVAYKKREMRYNLSLDATPDEINEVLTAAADVEALVAAGGWCAPSEINYNFFNIVCEDGLIDLPSVGILNRGGFRWPTSPTIADIFGDPDVLWSWTEQQDIDAVTSDSDLKTCSRVPCPDFEEVRAACDGLCVTAGNLIDSAYPEAVANFIQTVMAARAHRTNQLVIAQLVANSTAVSMTGSGEGTTASVLNSVELQADDYRERFRMCETDVIEAHFPRWIRGAIRADLANRFGMNRFDITNAEIAGWFDDRSIRVQFLADWQSGFAGEPIGAPGTIATSWPTQVSYLLHAPGTFVRGQGLQLDLGVVRDSELNSRNDHTAAWMEDCYAVAMVGHESRLVTTDVCTAGVVGAAVLDCPAGS